MKFITPSQLNDLYDRLENNKWAKTRILDYYEIDCLEQLSQDHYDDLMEYLYDKFFPQG